jgi:hypothetical protein
VITPKAKKLLPQRLFYKEKKKTKKVLKKPEIMLKPIKLWMPNGINNRLKNGLDKNMEIELIS